MGDLLKMVCEDRVSIYIYIYIYEYIYIYIYIYVCTTFFPCQHLLASGEIHVALWFYINL